MWPELDIGKPVPWPGEGRWQEFEGFRKLDPPLNQVHMASHLASTSLAHGLN